MRVMLDTNIIISAYVLKSRMMIELTERLASKYSLVLCSYIIDELRDVIKRKFPAKIMELEKILIETPFEYILTPQTLPKHNLFSICDEDDEKILYSAILADVDILVTGDKDYFSGVEIERPEILTPKDFLQKY